MRGVEARSRCRTLVASEVASGARKQFPPRSAGLIGRAKRDQSRGWLGFRTGVEANVVYLRKPAFAEGCKRQMDHAHTVPSASCQGVPEPLLSRFHSCIGCDGLGRE
jgi:hypothetical protein